MKSLPASDRAPLAAPPASRLEWWSTLRALPRETRAVLRERWRLVLGALGGGLAFSLGLIFVEHPWQELTFTVAPGTAPHIAAGYLSWLGKFENATAILLLGWLLIAIRRRERAAQASIATIVWAQVLVGLLVNLAKIGFGRTRPNSGFPDGFFGPSLAYAYQSFPSGHTAAAFTLAATLGVLRPFWALPLLAFALAVAWSRVALFVHHPSDVVAGAVLGGVTGFVCARAGRRLGAGLPEVRGRSSLRLPRRE
jgi:membrane-associated phospholipid phosphatase